MSDEEIIEHDIALLLAAKPEDIPKVLLRLVEPHREQYPILYDALYREVNMWPATKT